MKYPREKIGVRIDQEDLQKIDRIILSGTTKHKNRSDFIRAAIKQFLKRN
ncbi:MAG: ribbon-helix-helix domain-containing protein [Novosphingobium sp.]|nr:ribbon-helix-helix domain-containing protein [Novosphingobium sp.]